MQIKSYKDGDLCHIKLKLEQGVSKQYWNISGKQEDPDTIA